MDNPRYLNKSKFKLACDCPSKLFYTANAEYANQNAEDSFLEALAEGGFQVGELAKLYFPGGVDIQTMNPEEALALTAEELKKPEVIIYEAAISFENLFIRIDVLHKKGNRLYLYEVKAKSAEPDEDFVSKNGLEPKWKPYVYDVAFQHHVLSNAYPAHSVQSHLTLVDKTTQASVDGLNQLFKIAVQDGRTVVKTDAHAHTKDLGAPLLHHFLLNDLIALIYTGEHLKNKDQWEEMLFLDRIKLFSLAYTENTFLANNISKACKTCEFRTTPEEQEKGMKSGFESCWTAQTSLDSTDLKQPLVYDLWAGQWGSKNYLDPIIESRRYLLNEIIEEDLYTNPSKTVYTGLSPIERRMLQIEKVSNKDYQIYFDKTGYMEERATWKYPLHFIDFETSMVAIPFHAGRKPYEQMAFQFSHHQVDEDGTIEHKDQFIHTERGQFPNYDFVRALKEALTKDAGTIFRYSNHENTVLNQIRKQLNASDEPDKEELIAFIDDVTNDKKMKRAGGYRDMVDLWALVKAYYYDVAMGGSNSIKDVLPSVLNQSDVLKQKYATPIYGTPTMKSLNLENRTWIQFEADGKVQSPYKQLGAIFEEGDFEKLDDIFVSSDGINGGGAAMTAWARMQFTEMSDLEHDRVSKALLRYCELDTLAMVMIWEYWEDLIG